MDAVVAAAMGVMEAFRALDLPICYSHRDDRKNPTYRGSWDEKLGTMRDFQYSQGACGGE